MHDREKVIKGLECCGYSRFMDKCQECPYDGKDCFKRLKTDALTLLKEQEPKSGHWVDKCCRDFRCSECGHRLVKNNWVRSDGYCYDDLPKYCPECGVKMERGIIQRRFIGEDKIVYPDYNKNT